MVSRLKTISKTNRQSINNDNITIDAKHSEMINYFKDLNDSIPLLKEELKKIILEYNTKDNNKKNDIEYILYRNNLRDKINEIKNKINSISNNDEINKYYLDVGILLHSYYENIENSKNISNSSENFEENLINYDDIDNDNDIESLNDITDNDIEENESKINYKSVAIDHRSLLKKVSIDNKFFMNFVIVVQL